MTTLRYEKASLLLTYSSSSPVHSALMWPDQETSLHFHDASILTLVVIPANPEASNPDNPLNMISLLQNLRYVLYKALEKVTDPALEHEMLGTVKKDTNPRTKKEFVSLDERLWLREVGSGPMGNGNYRAVIAAQHHIAFDVMVRVFVKQPARHYNLRGERSYRIALDAGQSQSFVGSQLPGVGPGYVFHPTVPREERPIQYDKYDGRFLLHLGGGGGKQGPQTLVMGDHSKVVAEEIMVDGIGTLKTMSEWPLWQMKENELKAKRMAELIRRNEATKRETAEKEARRVTSIPRAKPTFESFLAGPSLRKPDAGREKKRKWCWMDIHFPAPAPSLALESPRNVVEVEGGWGKKKARTTTMRDFYKTS